VRRLLRAHAEPQIALDVLDDDDRVVDDDADRQHQPEQRKVIERKAEGGEHRKGANKRDRDCHDRDDRGAPGLQEQNDDDDDEDDGLEDRLLYFVDRFGDEFGRVIDDVVSEAAREAARQLPDRRHDAIGRSKRIRAGTLEDQQRYGLPLVEIAVGAVILGAEFDACDITDARDAPVRIVPDDDIGELARVDEAPQRLDIQLKGAGACRRRLIEDARGDLDILCLKRSDDLAGGQVAGCDLVRIEPNPHCIVARAKDPNVANAVEPRQHILHLKRVV